MDLINIVNLYLLKGVRGIMQLDVDLTYKPVINLGHSS